MFCVQCGIFDWIDIEYTAATKIQSIVRRNCVMSHLERIGCTTSAIRNSKRRRKASNRSYGHKIATHDETPTLFNCCAMGLAFGDASDPSTALDDIAYRQYQKQQYKEKTLQQDLHEEQIRSQYFQQHGYMDSVTMINQSKTRGAAAK